MGTERYFSGEPHAGLQGPFAPGEAGDGYRRLFSALPLPAVVIDSLGFVRLANQQASDLLGLARHAWLQQRSILQFLKAEDRQRLVWRLSDRSGQEVFEIHGLELITEHDQRVACDLHLVHLEGTVTHEPMSLLVVVDRTLEAEFREGEERLRRQSQRLADVIWASRSGIWEWDVRSGEITVNERFAELIGTTLDDIEPLNDRAFLAMIHPADRTAMQALVQQADARPDRSFELRIRLSPRGGGWIWALNRGRVLERDDYERPLRLAGTLLDISAEVEREESLRAAKEQAEASERLKSEWLANVSHEVRTPLNSVLGLVQLMQEWPGDERQQEALSRVVESANLLRHTLDDLLDNAKLEAGQLVLEQVSLDLSELADSVMAVFTQRALNAGVELTCTLAGEVPRQLMGDPLRLRQVINNLVANALKFTSRGQVEVVIGGHDTPLGGTFDLRVEVRDTGVGIAPEHLGLLFNPYYQADASTSRRFGGTGLGLSIARRMVSLMGGRIGVDSQLGRGSRFWFVVPLAVEEGGGALQPTPPPPSGRHWTSSGDVHGTPVDPAEPLGPETRSPNEEQAMWAQLRESLILQEHRSLELCQDLMDRVDGATAATLRRVLRHAREFNFEAALGELPQADPSTPIIS